MRDTFLAKFKGDFKKLGIAQKREEQITDRHVRGNDHLDRTNAAPNAALVRAVPQPTHFN